VSAGVPESSADRSEVSAGVPESSTDRSEVSAGIPESSADWSESFAYRTEVFTGSPYLTKTSPAGMLAQNGGLMTAKPTGSSFSSCSLPAAHLVSDRNADNHCASFHRNIAPLPTFTPNAEMPSPLSTFPPPKSFPTAAATFALKPISVSTANETFPLKSFLIAERIGFLCYRMMARRLSFIAEKCWNITTVSFRSMPMEVRCGK